MTDAVPNYAELPLGRFVDMVASREPRTPPMPSGSPPAPKQLGAC
jgi:hypothetical protein